MNPLTCFLFVLVIVMILSLFYFFMTKYNQNHQLIQQMQTMFASKQSDPSQSQSQTNSILNKMLSYMYDQQNQPPQKEVVYAPSYPYYPQSLMPDPYYLSGCSYGYPYRYNPQYPWNSGNGNGDSSSIQVKVNNNIPIKNVNSQPQPKTKISSPRRFAPQRKLTPTRKSTTMSK